MYKDDLSRELYPNFTYQIEKMHFGMYMLDCHVASLLAMSRTHPRAYRVLLCKTCGNTGELIATIFWRKSRK